MKTVFGYKYAIWLNFVKQNSKNHIADNNSTSFSMYATFELVVSWN